MQPLKLDIHRGLPMYFLNEKTKTLNRRITFAHTVKQDVGQELELGLFIFRIDEISEQRLSPLPYGVEAPVYFHDVVAKAVRKIDIKNINGVQQRTEIPIA